MTERKQRLADFFSNEGYTPLSPEYDEALVGISHVGNLLVYDRDKVYDIFYELAKKDTSGTAKVRSSHSISAMACSASIRHNI